MSAAEQFTAIDPGPKPKAKAPPGIAMRAEPPQATGLPSRKILLAGALLLGGLAALALMTGLSGSPSRRPVSAPAELQAAQPPENIRAAAAGYSAASFETKVPDLEPPVDRMWGPDGPPQAYWDRKAEEMEADPAWSDPEPLLGAHSPEGHGGPYPTSTAPSPDPEAIAADAARTSPILFERPDHFEGPNLFEGSATRSPAPGVTARASSHVHLARLEPPAARALLQAGSVIPAALQTELNSDLPGGVIALVTAPVRDSLTGEHLLIPQGARLIGRTGDKAAYGDQRLKIAWSRLVFPNGWSIDLEGFEAADGAGAAGLGARVDNHLDRIAVASLFSGVLSTAANAAEDEDSSVFARSVGDAAAAEAARIGARIIDRELAVRPTLSVPAGAPVRVLVLKDLVLKPYPPARGGTLDRTTRVTP